MPDHACTRALEARTPRSHRLAALAALAGLLLLGGCEAGRSAQQSVSGWYDETFRTTTPQGPGRVWYAADERTRVYSQPDASSTVLGVLEHHEEIARYQSDSGFAYVETQGELAGWVAESQLVAQRPPPRRPAEPEPSKPAQAAPAEPAEATPAPEDAAATDATPPPAPDAPTPSEPAGPETEPSEPEGSVFDPY